MTFSRSASGIPGPSTDAQVTTNGAYLVTQSATMIAMWDVTTGRRLATFTADGYFTRMAIEEAEGALRVVSGDALGRVHRLRLRF